MEEQKLLTSVSKRAAVKEGAEAVRLLLREIYRSRKIGTKELAYRTHLPVPVVAAVRRELERDGLIKRDKGALLTDEGMNFVRDRLGFIYEDRMICPTCNGRTITVQNRFFPLMEILKSRLTRRPMPLPEIDQSHGTPETALLRALFMLEKGDVEGRRVLFLGDDDFTSLAVGLMNAAREVAVIDVDQRILATINEMAEDEGFACSCIHHDLRDPLPDSLLNRFDVVFTDPPYTLNGLALFLSRAITALQRKSGAVIYLAFAHQPPRRMLTVQKIVTSMGLALTERQLRFNRYEGAEILANTTSLTRLETTAQSYPLVIGRFDGKLYTGEVTPTVRKYGCRCGAVILVGSTQRLRTVQDLKRLGCSQCRRTKGFQLMGKTRLADDLLQRLILREYRWSDFSVILAFEREIAELSFASAPILDEDYHRTKLKRAINRTPDGLKVATLDEDVVGWLWLTTEKDRNTNERFGYIKSIVVQKSLRLQGLGRVLLNEAEQHLRRKGIRRVDLIVSATNSVGEAFFESAGYRREHSTMRKRLMVEG
ncbi:MAG: GNAT family N-acetyltransferase [Candidatus Bathyarchaeota archaeon]|nr:MAG: GNAT family N-acetyltransferase [Candidatus Bathyarchaeota archaeon]